MSGLGPGALAVRLARPGTDVIGVDLAPALIETAKRLAADMGIEVRYEVGDAENLPYDDASFDVVASRSVRYSLPTTVLLLGSSRVSVGPVVGWHSRTGAPRRASWTCSR